MSYEGNPFAAGPSEEGAPGTSAARRSLLTREDVYLFNEGSHFRLHDKLGCHLGTLDGRPGAFFAVWAPNAREVSVVGDFNGWEAGRHPLRPLDQSGIWEGFVPGVRKGACYKYRVHSRFSDCAVDKADPFAVRSEVPPRTASVVWELSYKWGDQQWMTQRRHRNALDAPMSVYEVHLGSWRRVPEEGNRPLTYRELAPLLTDYVQRLGFTHVEFLPLMEHPYYPSWGYQTTGYFAPTSRYGSPQDLMYLIDYLHRHNVGVLLDWVPSHFPTDEHGLARFDGTHLFEHADVRQGFHPEWKSCVFNYARNEVRSFLVSSACYWLDKYHADGLRVDGVASMLYLDYSRGPGGWVPNQYGGHENLEAMSFLKRLNEEVYRLHPDVQMLAEESTAWPMVSRPTYVGGLGFGLKWDMGWMHDTLKYLGRDPVHRKFHHNQLTFRMLYAFTENFILPLSHDEVVHGKGSLLDKMPGDDWQKFANLRLLLGYMAAQPGKKLLFMGGEIGQRGEWDHDASLDWHLLEHGPHAGVQNWVRDLNRLYRSERALHERDLQPEGFEWIDGSDWEQSVVGFLRHGKAPDESVLVVCNFTPVVRYNYRIGVPCGGPWKELANSDGWPYGGSNCGNQGVAVAEPVPCHGRPFSLDLCLPPLGIVFLKRPTG